MFKIVIFDFAGVDAIGQAFADEIFRVFSAQHPTIELHALHVNSQIKRMIERARAGQVSGGK
ncbi:MAG TPA: STAS-like domain-containing protein [Gammaproteobacteria bacterium]|nr:STAS-like domain-containing protein [Gammaproteobacteria bacterium]